MRIILCSCNGEDGKDFNVNLRLFIVWSQTSLGVDTNTITIKCWFNYFKRETLANVRRPCTCYFHICECQVRYITELSVRSELPSHNYDLEVDVSAIYKSKTLNHDRNIMTRTRHNS